MVYQKQGKYDEAISEFDKTNLIAEYKDNFHAPFLKNSPLQMSMKFEEEYVINANDTILVVGSVQNIYFDEKLLEDDGFINLAKGNVAAINGLDGYAIPESSKRFPYQRPK